MNVPGRVVIIGAGLGGLATACHLTGRGYDVVVIDAEDVPGGRAGTMAAAGYRFDTGPTVLTMPELLDSCFRAAGVEMSTMLALKRVDPMYRACFADGSEIHVRHGRTAMSEEIRAVCGPTEADSFERFCNWLARLYRVEMPHFIDRNFDSPIALAARVRPLVKLLRLGGFRRLAPTVASFFRDERLQRLFTFQSMYAGIAPYEALALYAVITYMDTVNGVYVPEGGMHTLPTALAQAAENAGAECRYSTRVERILLERGSDGPARGVRLAGGETILADAVVCNADLPVAYRTLLPGLAAPRAARRGRYSPSAVVWHGGVRGPLPPGTAHHNLHFGTAWTDAFRALIRDGIRMPDPSMLVSAPTISVPEMAPPGRHVIYALEPVPNLDGRVDWTAERAVAQEALVSAVGAAGYPVDADVASFVDPLDWEARGMERGTPFALSHTFFQTGPFRPGNVDRRAPGVVFVGSGTVPGVGIPMVLVSGALAAQRATDYLAAR